MKKRTTRKVWFGYGAPPPEQLELRTLLSASAIVAEKHSANMDAVFADFDAAVMRKKKAPTIGGNLSGFSATATASTTGQVVGQQKVMTLTISAGKKPANFFGAQFNVGPGILNVEMKIGATSFGDVALDGTGGIVSIGQASYRTIPKNGMLKIDVYVTADVNANGVKSFLSATNVAARRPGVGKKAIDLTTNVTGGGSKANFTAGAPVVINRTINITGEHPLNPGDTETLAVNLSSSASTDTLVNLTATNGLTIIGPSTITIPAGMTSANFTVQGNNTSTNPITGIVTASTSLYGSDTAQITVNGAAVVNRTIKITGEHPLNPGDTETLAVNLSSAAVTDTVVSLGVSSGLTLIGGSTVTIPAGMTSANFTVQGNNTSTNPITGIVTASTSLYGSDTAQIVVNGVAAPVITMDLSNGSPIIQGATETLTVTFSSPVPSATTVNLSSSNSGAMEIVGGNVLNVPAGATSATFTVRAVPTGSNSDASSVITASSIYGTDSTTVVSKGIVVVPGAEYDTSIIVVELGAGVQVPAGGFRLGPIHYTQVGGRVDPAFFKFTADLDGDGNAGGIPAEYIAGATIATGPSGDAVVNAPNILIGAGGLLFEVRSRQPDANNITMIPDSVDFTDGAGKHYRTNIVLQPGNGGRFYKFIITGLV